MKIRMSEINSKGEEFQFDRASGELNSVLKDLTDSDYNVDLKIQKKDTFFEIKGELKTECDEVCSVCGDDLNLKLKLNFSDMLIEKPVEPRGAQYSKSQASTFSLDSADVAYYEGDLFDLGEYLHEQLAIRIPEYPRHEEGQCTQLEVTRSYMDQVNRESESFDQEKEGHPGFAALKNLKI